MSFTQYLKETQSELRHVAWPTRSQTIIYTSLVVGLSIVVSLYLGVFDYLFTSALGKGLDYLPQTAPLQISDVQVATSTPLETLPTPSAEESVQ